jgi:hypothetical protein
MKKKVFGILAAGLLAAVPAMAEEVPQATAPAYNCDFQPSCEVAPGLYGKISNRNKQVQLSSVVLSNPTMPTTRELTTASRLAHRSGAQILVDRGSRSICFHCSPVSRSVCNSDIHEAKTMLSGGFLWPEAATRLRTSGTSCLRFIDWATPRSVQLDQ